MLALLMILLPLRGWMGDAMAIEMSVAQLNAPQNIATPPGAARASGLFGMQASGVTTPDCHDTLAPGAAPADPSAHASDSGTPPHSADTVDAADCNLCSACQSCHMVGVPALHHPHLTNTAPSAHASAAHPLFKGVTLDPGLKPPIS